MKSLKETLERNPDNKPIKLKSYDVVQLRNNEYGVVLITNDRLKSYSENDYIMVFSGNPLTFNLLFVWQYDHQTLLCEDDPRYDIMRIYRAPNPRKIKSNRGPNWVQTLLNYCIKVTENVNPIEINK